jgi:hypothetical protein
MKTSVIYQSQVSGRDIAVADALSALRRRISELREEGWTLRQVPMRYHYGT